MVSSATRTNTRGCSQASFLPAANKLASMAELEKTSLEWTIICNGFFLDYWGMPKVQSYLQPTVMVVDIAARVAAVPGLGNTPVVFTHSFDVGKYVAACLGLSKWEREFYVVGDRVTWNEFVRHAEEAVGESSSRITLLLLLLQFYVIRSQS